MPVAPVEIMGRRFTRTDLEDMPDDGRRYELIDGVLVVSAAPGRAHQRAAFSLAVLLRAACPPDEFEVLVVPFAVGLAEDTELQPDIVHVKKERLRCAGTPAYWVVDPVARPAAARLIAWQLAEDGEFKQVADVVGDEPFEPDLPFLVRVAPADLVRWPPVT